MDVIRRALAVLALLLCALPVHAQNPPAPITGSLTATGSVTARVAGYASLGVQLSNTFTATAQFEASTGTDCSTATYVAWPATPSAGGSTVTSATATGLWTVTVGGLSCFRVRVSAYTSGTVGVTMQLAASGGGSSGGGSSGSAPSGTIGAAVPATASPVAVIDASGNLAYPALDGSGNLIVAVTGAGSGGTSSTDGAGYTAATTAGTPVMGARDDAGTTACAEDKICIARLTSSRALLVDLSATTANGTAIKVDGSAATQPVSGTFWQVTQPVSAASLPLPTGASTDATLGNVLTTSDFDTKTGSLTEAAPATDTASSGLNGRLQRVAQRLTSVLAIFPATLTLNKGASDASTLRVTLGDGAQTIGAITGTGTFATQSAITAASGSIASGAIASGAVASGAFASGSIASGAMASGAVASGAYGSDSGSFGVGATGSAVPAKAEYIGGNGSGNLTGFIRCDNSITYDASTNGKTQLVALSNTKVVYVCGVSLTTSSSTTTTVSLGSGTGSNCATTYTAKTPAWPIQGPTSVGPTGLVLPIGIAPWFQTAASEELCISTNAAVSVQAIVSYTQF